jgi:3-mercaptopropionate dioxygenase
MELEIGGGCRRLAAALEEVIAASATPEAITRGVQRTLESLIQQGEVELPAALRRTAPDSYARRLICANPEVGFTVLAMVWGPGQGTPLHDHAGLWCVEGVLEGRIRVTQYELLERTGDLCRFEPQTGGEAEVGSAGRLIPPFDYHVLANALSDQPSITLHVYGGEMDHCNVFEPQGGGWYVQRTRQLALTA